MNRERFIELLQMLLSMVDPASMKSIWRVHGILEHLERLEEDRPEDQRDYGLFFALQEANDHLEALVQARESFVRLENDERGNLQRLRRLDEALLPHCG